MIVSVFNCSHFTFMIRIRVFAKLYSYVSHLYVSCSEPITSVVGKELICWLSFTCNYLVSVRRDFPFLWMLGLGCVILLWHSLGIPYNYFVGYVRLILGQIIEIKQRRMLCKIVPQTQMAYVYGNYHINEGSDPSMLFIKYLTYLAGGKRPS